MAGFIWRAQGLTNATSAIGFSPPPATCTNTSGRAHHPINQSQGVHILSFQVVHNMPDASPSSSPRTQLEPWAQRSLQELRSLTTEQTLPPSSASSLILSPPSSSSANKRREATIEDTLAQLSALAGGKSEKGKGNKAPSLHTMDQDKPILATPIKEEKQ